MSVRKTLAMKTLNKKWNGNNILHQTQSAECGKKSLFTTNTFLPQIIEIVS